MIDQKIIMVDKKDRLQIIILRWIMLASFWVSTAYIAYTFGYSDGISNIKNKIAGNSAFLCDIAEDKPNYPVTRGYCIGLESFNNLPIDK